eukprot:SAG11_NODE_2849_length_2908_cov_2.301175_4_plen_176_part_01
MAAAQSDSRFRMEKIMSASIWREYTALERRDETFDASVPRRRDGTRKRSNLGTMDRTTDKRGQIEISIKNLDQDIRKSDTQAEKTRLDIANFRLQPDTAQIGDVMPIDAHRRAILRYLRGKKSTISGLTARAAREARRGAHCLKAQLQWVLRRSPHSILLPAVDFDARGQMEEAKR